MEAELEQSMDFADDNNGENISGKFGINNNTGYLEADSFIKPKKSNLSGATPKTFDDDDDDDDETVLFNLEVMRIQIQEKNNIHLHQDQTDLTLLVFMKDIIETNQINSKIQSEYLIQYFLVALIQIGMIVS